MTNRTRKRSRHVALFLAGTAVLTLAACEEEKTDAAAFPDLQSCLSEAQGGSLFFTEEDCRTQFAAAEANHLETAPRYDSKQLCEQEHGAGNCETDPTAQNQSGGSSIFMPMLMGYMIGSMLGGRGGVFSQPMVKTANGGYSTPAGNQTFASNKGTGKVAGSTFNKAPATMGKAPMTSAQVSQRGGFGGSSTARSTGSRSYGG
ncbi:MAG: DUF1190 domain-containing protein [Paracoccus sp. (in: a-proteobacteria)]